MKTVNKDDDAEKKAQVEKDFSKATQGVAGGKHQAEVHHADKDRRY
jgi:hypothetical protein